MRFTNSDAKYALKKLKINQEHIKFPIDQLTEGMNVELEHGIIHPELNVTNNDLIKTAKIALAHLYENPNYYKKLKAIELLFKRHRR